ncbi:hypothetical protein NG701_01155 [Pseudarthrobacter sp. HLT3-5]|uniref:hypothetical protein n=1 Tax=Pseudarthrobacter cellobiosi TaxID=2953654 RepID=UPI00208EA4FF|nr:hypothetical protein [Pseudarthrobacter sp. HLT3-5]MCO4273053.1 hypothetical protein [Pseudarthrobacter sp. HLT3-5]
MNDNWRPLGFESDTTTYDALHDGVPDWMAESFWDWMRTQLLLSQRSEEYPGALDYFLDQDLVRQVERRCRVAIPYRGYSAETGMSEIRGSTEVVQAQLRVADFLLATRSTEHAADKLNIVLEESGSMWRVGERSGSRGLVRRVPDSVQTAVDNAILFGGHAGARLAQAWAAIYGIDPNPSLAYSLSVKAVEDAAIPVVSPNDTSATLGKINSQIRNTGDWSLPLQREDEHTPASSTLLSMMKMLWAGQADRHGGHHDPDLVITHEAAEVAVMTAATLVQWFTAGLVTRR